MARRTPRPAGELITGWFAGLTAAGDTPPAAPAAPVDGDAPDDGDSDLDAQITDALDAADKALQAVIDLQAGDTDSDSDKAVAADLQTAADAIAKAKQDQLADVASDSDAAPTVDAPPTPADDGNMAAPPAGAPGSSPAEPTAAPDPDNTRPGSAPVGDVPNDSVCADGECAHPAVEHQNTTLGANTGVCAMAECACQGMRVPDADAIGSGQPPVGGDPHATTPAAFAADGPLPGDALDPTTQTPGATGSPSDPAANTAADDSSNNGPEDGGPGLALPTGAINGPAFTIPVLIIEGITTSDGRMVAPGALTWRNPPLPLMGLSETTDYGHTGAVIVGRIDAIMRDGDHLSATGFFDTSEDGLEFARLVEQQMIVGVSADIADTTSEVTVTGVGEDGFPTDVADTITAGEVMGATVCPFPAFEGAYIVLGDGTDSDAPIPQTPTPEQAAAGIHVLSTKACAPCEAGALVASSVPLAPPTEWFTDPELTEPTKLTVDDDGRVYGHLAAWGTCHVATSGTCVTPPRGTDYGFFHTGYVVTADGTEVATGPITVGTGHATTRERLSAAAAMAHYDNTGTAAADVSIGEDEHGIWIAGAVRPTASDEQVHMLRASAVSGDWRPVGNRLELVAALAVNRPGFPITKATTHDGETTSLVAAGMLIDIAPEPPAPLSLDDRLARLEGGMRAVAPLAVEALRGRVDALRD